jgi:hypothetical protein
MKKLFSTIFVAAMVTLVACGGKKSDLIAGSWKIGDMAAETPKDLPDSLKKAMDAQSKAGIEEMKKSCTFEFNKDGSYSVKMMGTETKGKWKLSEDGLKITMSGDTKDKQDMTGDIVELTSSKMVFSMVDQGLKQTLTLVK